MRKSHGTVCASSAHNGSLARTAGSSQEATGVGVALATTVFSVGWSSSPQPVMTTDTTTVAATIVNARHGLLDNTLTVQFLSQTKAPLVSQSTGGAKVGDSL